MRGPAATQPTYHPARMIKVINNRRQLLESKELKSAVLRDSFITIDHSFCSIVTHSLLSILPKKPLPQSPEPFPGRCFAQNAVSVFVAKDHLAKFRNAQKAKYLTATLLLFASFTFLSPLFLLLGI